MDTRYDNYVVVLNTRRLSDLCLKYNSYGVYFRMASRLMDYTQTESEVLHYKEYAALVASE